MTDVPPYDPDARRDTPLALKLKALIRAKGPITVTEYMQACLQDPEHGYYRTKTAIGRRGDFITAPEISQVFGELIGLWCVVVWRQMGQPASFKLIELGPGRGTLMADALRAAKMAPGFLKAAEIALVETSAVLKQEQEQRLCAQAASVQWFDSLDGVPYGPSIIIGNEFLDTAAPAQFVATEHGQAIRRVGLDTRDRLQFVARPGPAVQAGDPPSDLGPVKELQFFDSVANGVGLRAGHAPQAVLLVDYGHIASEQGDSLQAVRAHHYEHPLTSPGEADLSIQVDFARAAEVMAQAPCIFDDAAPPLCIDGPVTQAEFLGSLGIIERAQKLMAANPTQANAIEMAVARLIAPNGMGTRFKAMGVRSPSLPPLPGFPF